MEGGIVYEDSHHMTNVLMKNESSEVLDSLWVPNSSPSYHGTTSMVNFEDVRGANNTNTPFFTQIDPKSENLNNDEMDNVCFNQPEKKRRLLPEQVQFLEKSFEVENKLEPERKVQLAKELGLQPRQVAIWFQNRRARYKTKHLEKEYDALKANYDNLKTDYDTLFEDNEKLKNEILLLTEKLLAREDEKTDDPSNLPRKKPKLSLDDEKIVTCKLEGVASSAKSDILDSDSPQYYTEGNHSALLEPADSSHVFEPEASDFSQDEDDNSIGRNFLQPTYFPKVELETFDDLQPNSCNLGFPVQDQGTWFWQY